MTVFDNPMTLIPAKEMDRWFERLIEQSKDPDVVLVACSDIELSKMGLLGRWIFSCNDLALIIRRLSFGLGCLQSGAFFSGKKTRSFIKWTYTSKNFGPSTIVHESIRMAILMHKVLTFCLGKSFAPVKLRLPGRW
ncbi:araC-type DNA-binding domain-containing protein [Vibrio ishigakensis]|uniref:AraC-type DNA-binding domain-containing protein n=1 Tax=Vibrio ishigakensis TaxID=1481914 RepID=A0A0B8PGE5_9VIBR|nr:araC-type DNA-binding domain-containing protein [Vibrio ishigakensis]